jgi:L-ascorbate metabolism protein UlaG (beta-lactamase superfamily)
MCKFIAATAVYLSLSLALVGGEVVVTYLGHSCFTIATEDGVAMIDPYATYVPYPGLPQPADVVLITHGHIDHCPWCYGEKDRVTGDPVLVWPFNREGRVDEGRWRITDWLTADFIEATHVTRTGGGQGLVCLFSFELGGIWFAHLGDLGRPLSEEQVASLGEVQVLMIPVGGAFTIDAAEAVEVIGQLPSVRVVLPMHYFVEGYCPWEQLATIDGFLAEARAQGWAVREFDSSQVTLSPETLSETLEVWVLPFLVP